MAAWAYALLWVSIGGFVVTATGVVLVVRSLRLAAESNKLTLEEQRAWIKLDLTSYRDIVAYNNGGFYSQITLRLSNIGHGVATDVRAFIRPYILDTSDDGPRVSAEAWLKTRLNNRHPQEVTRIVFPNETISWEPDLMMPPGEFPFRSERFILRVAAMVEYRTKEIGGLRYTYANFDIFSDNEGISETILLDLPKVRIRVAKNGIGYAT
jgi:hypothetical protein